jgi:hypothetical protein
VAQEFQPVDRLGGQDLHWDAALVVLQADRRVTCYYFYLLDAGFGPYADRPVMPHRMTWY